MRIINFIKKNWIFIIIIIVAIIPFIINLLFKIPAPNSCFSYEINAGEAIGAYASILSAIGTIYLGYIAYSQNERLLKLEMNSKKSYVLLNKTKSLIDMLDNGQCSVSMFFENATEIPIIQCKLTSSTDRIIDAPNVPIISTVGSAVSENVIDENKIEYSCVLSNASKNFIFSFVLTIDSIYGLKTIQLVNVHICPYGLAEVRIQEVDK